MIASLPPGFLPLISAPFFPLGLLTCKAQLWGSIYNRNKPREFSIDDE